MSGLRPIFIAKRPGDEWAFIALVSLTCCRIRVLGFGLFLIVIANRQGLSWCFITIVTVIKLRGGGWRVEGGRFREIYIRGGGFKSKV